MKAGEVGPRHIFIPDTQLKPGVPMEHLVWAGEYCAVKRPKVIIIGGDWYDMASLSSYDKGKLSSHGKSYKADLDAGRQGLELFERALAKHSPRGYKPRKIVTLGNHEERILRHVDEHPELHGQIGLDNLAFREHGWETFDFLRPVSIDGITYAHYFPLNAQGRVGNSRNGAPSALSQARRMMRSCVAGHRQGLDTAIIHTPGRTVRGVIAGSFYQHDEKYLSPMGETYWRGILVFNDIRANTGEFDVCEVSLNYLQRRFG